MTRSICVFTGTRAEYGLLRPLIQEIDADGELSLRLLVAGAHLSTEFGLTYRQIEQDGFRIDEKVEMLLSAGTPTAICKSLSLGVIGCAEALVRLRADLLVVLGDRYEAFGAAVAATVCRVPIAHLHGGEATFGLIDESMRHAITKMSHLHFAASEGYRQRIIQLGEAPESVFHVGPMALSVLKRTDFMDRAAIRAMFGFSAERPYVVVTFHPVTLENATAAFQFGELLTVLSEREDVDVVFTKCNADTEGRVINDMIDTFVADHAPRAVSYRNLGQRRYLSAIRHAAAVVGNSSSGVIEAPLLQTPTLNIGDRQAGRERAESVVDCRPELESVRPALGRVLRSRTGSHDASRPLDRADPARAVKEIIKRRPLDGLLKKRFYDLPAPAGIVDGETHG